MMLGRIGYSQWVTIAAGCLVFSLGACKDTEVFFGEADAGRDAAESTGPEGAERCTDPTWATMYIGYDVMFTDVWAASSTSAYAVTNVGSVFHYDGNAWTVEEYLPECEFYALAGRSGSDIFVAGHTLGSTAGCFYHYDGSEWLPFGDEPSPRIHDISLTDDGAFAAGRGVGMNQAWWYDGSAWTLLDNVLVRDDGVAALSSRDAYFLGSELGNCSGMLCDDYGHVLHYNGEGITSVRRMLDESYAAIGIHPASGQLFVVGQRFMSGQVEGSYVLQSSDGADFSVTKVAPGDARFEALWVADENAVFLAGTEGRISAYDGAAWSEMATNSSASLAAIHGVSATDLFAVGSGSTVLHYGCDHGNAEPPLEPAPSCDWSLVLDEGEPGNITGIWVDDQNLPHVAGSGVFHFDDLNEPPVLLWTGDRTPYAISGTGKYVFAVGESSLIVECVSGACSEVASPISAPLYGVFALSPTQVYAVGDDSGGNGVLLSYDGEAVTSSALPIAAPVRGIWGSSSDHLIAAGKGGIATWDGNTWQVAVTSSNELLEFTAVSGSAADDVYVAQTTNFVETADDLGGIWHFDGSAWTELDVDSTVTFYSVSAKAWDDVFAAGYRIKPVEGSNQGVVYHYDGTVWTETTGCFGAVQVVSGGVAGAFVAGAEEGLFEYAPAG